MVHFHPSFFIRRSDRVERVLALAPLAYGLEVVLGVGDWLEGVGGVAVGEELGFFIGGVYEFFSGSVLRLTLWDVFHLCLCQVRLCLQRLQHRQHLRLLHRPIRYPLTNPIKLRLRRFPHLTIPHEHSHSQRVFQMGSLFLQLYGVLCQRVDRLYLAIFQKELWLHLLFRRSSLTLILLPPSVCWGHSGHIEVFMAAPVLVLPVELQSGLGEADVGESGRMVGTDSESQLEVLLESRILFLKLRYLVL